MSEIEIKVNEWLLSMLNSDNGKLITELKVRWKEFLNTPVIEAKPKEQPNNKGWEIVEIKNPKTDTILNLNEDGALANYFADLIKNNKPTSWEIHSVYSEFNNDFYSIGDNTEWGKIKSFEISDNDIKVYFEDVIYFFTLKSYLLKKSKPKPQLSTQELEDKPLLSLNDVRDMYDSPKDSPLFLKLYAKLYSLAEFKNR